MVRDVEFFKSRTSKLDGAADIGDHLVDIVNAKTVAEIPKPAEPPIEPVRSTETVAEKPQDRGEKT